MAAAARFAGDPRPALEEKIRQDFGAEEVVLCGSGTQSLQRALLVARTRVGSDPVALPAFTCYDVATAAAGADARIVLYDIDPHTLGPDLESLRRALGAGARTVVVAPLYGVPVDWHGLEELAGPYGALLLEDAAQGHGATWEDRPLGALGSVSVLSFGRGKGWTGGGGGALLLRGRDAGDAAARPDRAAGREPLDPRIVQELRILVAALAQGVASRPPLYSLPASIPWLRLGRTEYRPPGPIRPITRAAAALLLRSDDPSRREVDVRRATGAWYSERLETGYGLDSVPLVPGSRPGYLRYPVRLPAGWGAFADARRARRLGIAASYPTALSALEAVRSRLAADTGACPGADDLARTLFTLPTHSALTASERDAIVAMLDVKAEDARRRAGTR